MMSVAGGWFFLMACEMFVLGDKDFRLPGLGSFLQTAASGGNTRAMLWGLATMVAVIVLMDVLIWRPVIAWADKFKFEQVENSSTAQNSLLSFIRRESFLIRGYRRILHPIVGWLTLTFARGASRAAQTFSAANSHRSRRWLGSLFA
jgi:NitT/TauT family transport system permease protein